MNVFMAWHNASGVTVWYTVYSENLEDFYCELFLEYYGAYPIPPASFFIKKVAGGWQLEKACPYQKQIAHAIEHRLETDTELIKY